jgi:hypothetical protein
VNGCRQTLFHHLHLLLGVLQRSLAIREQLGTALVHRERFLQRQLAGFHPADKTLELGERGFETARQFGCLGHGAIRMRCGDVPVLDPRPGSPIY